MVIEPMNFSGPWDFEKYPIFPFYISDVSVPQAWRNELYQQLRAAGLISELANIEIVSSNDLYAGTLKLTVNENWLERFVKARVRDVSKAKLADMRKARDAEIIDLLSRNCHAALRRVATPTIPAKQVTVNVKDGDELWLEKVVEQPQPLGGDGVPNSVFHRLFAKEKVFINRDGLVEADPKTRRLL